MKRTRKSDAHLTSEANSRWTPLLPATVTRHDDHYLYDPLLDGLCFKNNLYTVFRRVIEAGVVHLSIRRNDRTTAKDWRDFQRIKNELAGPEWEAVELFPAESRLVDSANQYHLWCYASGIPVGFSGRFVTDSKSISGSKQRRLPHDWVPTSEEEIERLFAEVSAVRREATEDGVDLRRGEGL